jgi:hypothetical protein
LRTRYRSKTWHATIYHALGNPPTTSYIVEKRPVFITRDGTGKPIRALFQEADE